MFKGNFISPGLAYERHLIGPATVNVNAAFGVPITAFTSITIGGGSGISLFMQPYAELQLRAYLNLKSREENGKQTQGNSANYIAATWTKRGQRYYAFGGKVDNAGFLYGLRVGMQRTQRSGMFYRFDLGVALENRATGTFIEPATTYSLGYVFGMNKK